MSIGKKKNGISWTDATWNVFAGCDPIGAGCRNCYAEFTSQKLANNPNEKIRAKYLPVVNNGKWTGEITVTERVLIEPLRAKKSKMIFVNSMSDFFHKKIDDVWRYRSIAVMVLADWHVYQILTKRHDVMFEFFTNFDWAKLAEAFKWVVDTFGLNLNTVTTKWLSMAMSNHKLTRNQIYGHSASNQAEAAKMLPVLMETPLIQHRMLSAEPLLGFIDLTEIPNKLDWIVVGGESSQTNEQFARPCNPNWANMLLGYAKTHNIAFHFKQWGDWLPVATPRASYQGERVLVEGNGITHRNQSLSDVMSAAGYTWGFEKHGKKKSGCELNSQIIQEFPNIPTSEFVDYFKK